MKLFPTFSKTLAQMLCIVLTLSSFAYSQTPARSKQTRPNNQRALTPREIAQKTLPSVVLLVTQDSSGEIKSLGSGFFVRDDVIATNHHVIEGASRVRARIVGQKAVYEVTGFLGIDESRDLALLKVSGVKGRPLSFGNSNQVAVGDVVYAVGNPEGFEGTFSQGIVSGIRYFEGQKYIQITAPVSHGSSGGPVLNKDGEVIGVAVASVEEGQNLNFAVPVSDLSALSSKIKPNEITVPQEWFENDMIAGLEATKTSVPNSAKQYYEEGETLIRQSRYSKALEASKQAIRIKPDYYEAYVLQGRAYSLLERHSEAIQAYKKAIEINPNQHDAYGFLGMKYSQINYYNEAIAAYKQAIRLEPNNPDYYETLGLTYLMLGNYDDAIYPFKQAIKLKPDDADYHSSLGDAYWYLQRYSDAVIAYKQAIRLKPYETVFHYSLGKSYEGLRQYSDAIDSFKQAIRLKPDNANYHYFLGNAYEELRRYSDALDAYKQAIRLNPDLSGAHRSLGDTYFTLRQYQNAIYAYEQAIRVRGKGDNNKWIAETQCNIGLAYLNLGDKGSALEIYKILRTIDKQYADRLFNLIYR